MGDRRNSFAILISLTALVATTFLVSSVPYKVKSPAVYLLGDLAENDELTDFSKLIELIDSEMSGSANWPESSAPSIPPAVSAATDLSDHDKAAILDRVISDALENDSLQSSRDFYGIPGDRSAIVLTNGAAPWVGAHSSLASAQREASD
jgi:hypothetical protein